MKFIELFAGIGGFRLGLERAGHQCVWANEIDSYAGKVYRKNWPDGTLFEGDIRSVDPATLPAHDLLVGGFPCQPVSLAGRRQAQKDKRWLWPEIVRIFRVSRPKYLLLENVPGLLSAGMGDVLRDMADGGYDAEWDCLPAAAFGAPHLRYRVFIVGYPIGSGCDRQPRRRAGPQPSDRCVCDERGHVADTASLHGQRVERSQPNRILSPDVADAARQQALRRRSGSLGQAAKGRQSLDAAIGHGSQNLADANCKRCKECGRAKPMGSQQRGIERGGAALADADAGGRERRPWFFRPGWRAEPEDASWWSVEPDVGRVAYGISSRVDRLRCLGNAVVPQIIRWLGRRFKEIEEEA